VALLGIDILVIMGTFLGSWWLAGTAVRPVHEIIDQAESIEAGSPTRISAYAESEEYRRLVTTLNTMLERLQRSFHAQRQFTSDASHELRSPLTALRGELELALRRTRDPAEYEAVLRSSLEEVLRLARITDQLLLLARTDAGVSRLRLAENDLGSVVRGVLERVRPDTEAKGLSVQERVHTPALGTFDSVLVEQVVWNLLDNAVKFTPPEGEVRVSVSADAEGLSLIVEDSGSGFGSTPERVFERFYRADESRTHGEEPRGHGLGLSIVQAIVEAHGGRVSAGASALGGASVNVWLPHYTDVLPRDSSVAAAS
jgi:two-component system, OmpR family, sensor kinase